MTSVLRALLIAVLAAAALTVPTTARAETAPFGPDVSRWQHPNGAKIDWAAVRAGGSSFAISKATEGGTYTNPYFATDAADIRANGLVAGAYHYARPALPMSTAADQARYFAAVIGDVRTPGTLAPILDLETTGGLSTGQLVTWAQIFVETLRSETGRTPIIYTYTSFWATQMGGSSAFGRSPLWIAFYRSTPPPSVGGWPAWTMWQYTASGRLPGITGDVDINRFAGDAASLAALADGTAQTDWPVVAPAAPVAVKGSGGVRSASVRWVPADDGGALPSSYTVTASPGGTQVSVPGTSTTAKVAGLAEGTSYQFSVTATNVAGASPTSAPSVAVLARGDAPAAPAGVSTAVGRGSVTLAWPATTIPATSYTVRRCSPAPCTPTSPVATVGGTSYVDTAVIGGVSYSYALTAANRWGSSPTSSPAGAMPLPTVDRLAAPARIVATGSAKTLRVSWTPVPHAARYQVLRCQGAACVPGGTPVATVHIPAARLSQTVAAGSTWTYSVLAVAGPLASAPSRHATATAPIPQAVRITASPAVPVAGRPTTITVRVTRTDTGAALGRRAVTVSRAPARGPVPAAVVLRTDAAGVARLVIRPGVNQGIAVRSAAPDLVTKVTRVSLRVKPLVTGVLSAATVSLTPVPPVRVVVTPIPTPAPVPASTTVVLSGRTSPLYYGERVFRQTLVGGVWRLGASAPISRTGSYALSVPARPGVTTVRVYLGRTRLHDGGASAPTTLTAR